MVGEVSVAKRIARECLGVRVRLLNRVVSRVYDEELRPFGIKVSQLSVLVAVSLQPGLRPVEVGRKLCIEKSTLSRNLQRLAVRGWIEIDGGVQLTGSGKHLLKEVGPAWSAAQKRVRGLLGREGSAALAKVAESVRE